MGINTILPSTPVQAQRACHTIIWKVNNTKSLRETGWRNACFYYLWKQQHSFDSYPIFMALHMTVVAVATVFLSPPEAVPSPTFRLLFVLSPLRTICVCILFHHFTGWQMMWRLNQITTENNKPKQWQTEQTHKNVIFGINKFLSIYFFGVCFRFLLPWTKSPRWNEKWPFKCNSKRTTYSCSSVSHFFSTSPVSMYILSPSFILNECRRVGLCAQSLEFLATKRWLSLSLSANDLFRRFCLSKYLLCFQLVRERLCRMNYILLVWIFSSSFSFVCDSHCRIQSNFDNNKVVIRISVLSNGLLRTANMSIPLMFV